jgi:hypothetical protein
MKLHRMKIITSHTGKARYLAECEEEPIGFIDRREDIPSPYAYSPAWTVWRHGGLPVVIVETAHKRYEVFLVPLEMIKQAA